MKQTRLLMGMPITVEIVDKTVTQADINSIFDYFEEIDKRYSTYKKDSEISRINQGLPRQQWSTEMKQVLELCEQTNQETNGYFDIEKNGQLDPSGLVKGWAINNAAQKIADKGFKNFYVDAGGDIQVSGHNNEADLWRIGLRNPFNRDEIIKTIAVTKEGVATSGTAIRGQHIYNPKADGDLEDDIVAITVIGPDIYNADRFATAAFAMGRNGLKFIESLKGYEAYLVDKTKTATMTSGFDRYIAI